MGGKTSIASLQPTKLDHQSYSQKEIVWIWKSGKAAGVFSDSLGNLLRDWK